jgi:methylglutaconyl-CoA hydratase
MSEFRFLQTKRLSGVEYLLLNRPELRNALNDEVIAELSSWAARASQDPDLRAVVISGAGPSFCAGADLNWMTRMAGYSREENVRDAEAGARMFAAIDTLPVPVIARVHGAALGGGAGLVAVADIAVAEMESTFGFTEVRLGLLPAIIAPYVLAKIGESAARDLFLTGRRFNADRALQIGLVHAVVRSTEQLDAVVQEYVSHVLDSGRDAIGAAKRLIRQIANRPPSEVEGLTADAIATQRATADARERMAAFLRKNKR